MSNHRFAQTGLQVSPKYLVFPSLGSANTHEVNLAKTGTEYQRRNTLWPIGVLRTTTAPGLGCDSSPVSVALAPALTSLFSPE